MTRWWNGRNASQNSRVAALPQVRGRSSHRIGLRTHLLLLLGLALLPLVAVGGAAAAQVRSSSPSEIGLSTRGAPPVLPVPACFTQPGMCDGTFMKPGKLPIQRVAPKADGTYTFSWKPLQFKTPVSCGADSTGCLYNTLSWVSGAGAVVSGWIASH